MNVSFIQKLKSGILTVLLFSVLLLFTLRAPRYMQVFLKGVSLWATCVLPSSLPFLFLTALLTNTGSVQKLSKAFSPVCKVLFNLSGVGGYCLLTSVLCGYPVGAKALYDLYAAGTVRKDEVTKMSLLCSTSGPLFILGSVGGGMFQNQKVGSILLISHLFSVLLSGMVLRFFPTAENSSSLPPLDKTDNLLYESMYSSVLSALLVGGFVCIFYTFAVLLSDYKILYPLQVVLQNLGMPAACSEGVCFGLIEMTGGVGILSASATPLSVALCAFLITLGGLSILFQQICYFQKARVKLQIFLPVKLLQALFAFTLCYGFCLLFL